MDVAADDVKARLVRQLGGEFHLGDLDQLLDEVKPEIVVDTTGVSAVISAAFADMKPFEVLCLVGMHNPQDATEVDVATVGKQLVLDNAAVFGSVNANVHHWQQAGEALAAADKSWLNALLSRKVPLSQAQQAFEHQDGDIKVVIDLQS